MSTACPVLDVGDEFQSGGDISLEERMSLLLQVDHFRHMPRSSLELIAGLTTLVVFNKATSLTVKGDRIKSLMIIHNGEAVVGDAPIIIDNGVHEGLTGLGEGDIIGEECLSLADSSFPSTVKASSTVTCLCLSVEAYLSVNQFLDKSKFSKPVLDDKVPSNDNYMKEKTQGFANDESKKMGNSGSRIVDGKAAKSSAESVRPSSSQKSEQAQSQRTRVYSRSEPTDAIDEKASIQTIDSVHSLPADVSKSRSKNEEKFIRGKRRYSPARDKVSL